MMVRSRSLLGTALLLAALFVGMVLATPAPSDAACNAGRICGFDSDFYNGVRLFNHHGSGLIDFANNRLESVHNRDTHSHDWVEANGWPDHTLYVTAPGEDITDWGQHGLDNQLDHADSN